MNSDYIVLEVSYDETPADSGVMNGSDVMKLSEFVIFPLMMLPWIKLPTPVGSIVVALISLYGHLKEKRHWIFWINGILSTLKLSEKRHHLEMKINLIQPWADHTIQADIHTPDSPHQSHVLVGGHACSWLSILYLYSLNKFEYW